MNNFKFNEELYVLGEIKDIDKRSVAVVGSREMSEKGKFLTERFVKEFVNSKVTIVSGLARGIDTVAHMSALKYGGRTIAVLGSGIDVIYPPENKILSEEIVKSGALISGFANGTKPLPQNFLARNELIVRMSQAVLVIEGKKRSGTISTANHAGNEGVEVFAIPGSEATDFLIQNGASIANTPQDVLRYLDQLQ